MASIGELIPGFEPESDLERDVTADEELLAGLAWGRPRRGHPEGAVAVHVAAMLAGIERDEPFRAELRFLALVHDSFKHRVRPAAGYSRDNDHAVLARRFAERYTGDARLLVTLERHDEPYWVWRNQGGEADDALEPLLARLPDVSLFACFVEIDAASEGKDVTLLWWLRRQFAARGLLGPRPLRPVAPPVGDGAGDEMTYVKELGTTPESQAEVAAAAADVVERAAPSLAAHGEVLQSLDGLRVLLVWRWRGPVRPRLLVEGEIVREALERHPPLAGARALGAHVYRRAERPSGAGEDAA